MAPEYGAGSCCGLREWSRGTQHSFRKPDLRNHVRLFRINFIDCRVPHCVVSPNDSAVLSAVRSLLPPIRPKCIGVHPTTASPAISNDAGTMSLSITELAD
jgi:hypothetical protein